MEDKVYTIHEGCRWEGGATVAISKTYDGARAQAVLRVKNKQQQDDVFYRELKEDRDECDDSDPKIWEEERKDYWSNGYDIVTINEFNLLP